MKQILICLDTTVPEIFDDLRERNSIFDLQRSRTNTGASKLWFWAVSLGMVITDDMISLYYKNVLEKTMLTNAENWKGCF